MANSRNEAEKQRLERTKPELVVAFGRSEFPQPIEIPTDLAIQDCSADWLVANFGRKHWIEVPTEVYVQCLDFALTLERQAFEFYLPGLIYAALLLNYSAIDNLLASLRQCLTLLGDEKYLDSFDTSQQNAILFSLGVLCDQLAHKQETERFEECHSLIHELRMHFSALAAHAP